MRLEGKVALITGVATGIGRQIAITFARQRAQIIGADYTTGQIFLREGRKIG